MQNEGLKYYENICRQNMAYDGDTKIRHWILYFGMMWLFLSIYAQYSSSIASYLSTNYFLTTEETNILLIGVEIGCSLSLVMFFPSGIRKFVEAFLFIAVVLVTLSLLGVNAAILYTFLEPTTFVQSIQTSIQRISEFVNITTQTINIWPFFSFAILVMFFSYFNHNYVAHYEENTKTQYWICLFLSYLLLFQIGNSSLICVPNQTSTLFPVLLIIYKLFQYRMIYKKRYSSGISSGILFFDMSFLVFIFSTIFI